MVAQRDEIFRAGFGVEPDQFFGIPVFAAPEMANIFVPELRRMAICLDVVLVLTASLNVHAAGIPIALLRHALGTPMSPDPKLGVAKPIGMTIRFERLPIGS